MEGGICLRCGAPYEPDDTVCYTCGAPIGETRSNTQPVKAVRTQRPALPGETPALAAEAPHTSFREPPRLTVGSGPVQSTPLTPPVVKRHGRLRWVVVVALCLVLVAAVGGAVAVLRALTAAPPVAHQTVYTDPQRRFSFNRPALWKAAETPGGVTLSDSASISTAAVSLDDSTPGATAQGVADARAQRQGLTAAPSRALAGEPWQVRSGQVTGQDGVLREDVLLVTVHDGTVYAIEFVCPIASYDTTNALVYQPLLDSFRFGAPGK